jgi:hypothetical protein
MRPFLCREMNFRKSSFSETQKAIGNDKAPGFLFTEGFYRYSVFSTSLDVSNHHLNLLLRALRFSLALEVAWSLYAFSL